MHHTLAGPPNQQDAFAARAHERGEAYPRGLPKTSQLVWGLYSAVRPDLTRDAQGAWEESQLTSSISSLPLPRE